MYTLNAQEPSPSNIQSHRTMTGTISQHQITQHNPIKYQASTEKHSVCAQVIKYAVEAHHLLQSDTVISGHWLSHLAIIFFLYTLEMLSPSLPCRTVNSQRKDEPMHSLRLLKHNYWHAVCEKTNVVSVSVCSQTFFPCALKAIPLT